MDQAKLHISLDKELLQQILQPGSRTVACMLCWHASNLHAWKLEFKQTAQNVAQNGCF